MDTYVTRLMHGSYFCMEVETLSIDAIYNKSTVRVRLYVTNERTSMGLGNASCFIDGSCPCSFNMNIEGIAWSDTVDCTFDENTRERTVFEETYIIQHESNGKKTVRMCASIYNVQIHRAQIEEVEEEHICRYVHLVDIPQASEFGEIERDVTVNGVNALTVPINPLNNECRHDLIISLGEFSETVCNIKDETSIVIPVSWLAALPAADKMTGLITLRTFNTDGDELGEAVQTYWNAYVPDNAVPIFDALTIEQIQGSFSLSFGWVQYASRAHLEIVNPASEWGAEIVAFSIKGCGYSGTEQALDTGTLNYSGTRTFEAYITDSRGKVSVAKTVSITIQKYNPPRFLSALSQRCDSDKTLNNEGSYMLSTVTYEFDSFNGLNSIQSAAVYYKLSTAENYTRLSTAFTNGGSVRANIIFNIDNAYDIRYQLTDRFGTSYYDDVLSKSHISMEFLKGGKGIAFGKEAELENAADFGYKVYARIGLMPIEIMQSGNLANGVNIRDYSLFAVKTTLCDFWLLGFRELNSDVVKASFAQPKQSGSFGRLESWAATITISSDGDSFTATSESGSITPGSSYVPSTYSYDSGDTESIEQVYALI